MMRTDGPDVPHGAADMAGPPPAKNSPFRHGSPTAAALPAKPRALGNVKRLGPYGPAPQRCVATSSSPELLSLLTIVICSAASAYFNQSSSSATCPWSGKLALRSWRANDRGDFL